MESGMGSYPSSVMIEEFAEVRSRTQRRALANFEIGTLAAAVAAVRQLGARDVVSVLEMAKTGTPFDGALVQPKRGAVDPEQRRARRNGQLGRRVRIRRDGRQPVVGAHHQDAIRLPEQVVERVG